MNYTVAAELTLGRYCSFWLDKHWFGVPASSVSEVHAPTDMTPIPGAPRAVLGYVNLRGHLILVLDARELLLAASAGGDGGHLVVFKPTIGESFAVRTGSVGDIVEVGRDQVDIPKPRDAVRDGTSCQHTACVVGHAKLDCGLMTLIDPKTLLAAAFSR